MDKSYIELDYPELGYLIIYPDNYWVLRKTHTKTITDGNNADELFNLDDVSSIENVVITIILYS